MYNSPSLSTGKEPDTFQIFISKASINVQFSKTVHDIVGYEVRVT